MKKFNNFLIILCLIISLFSTKHIKAANNPYSRYTTLCDNCRVLTNCTWYAWEMAYNKAGVALPNFGNAKQWYDSARKLGYSVGTVPRPNSIVVWGNWTAWGHVGYVESFDAENLYVWDSNYVNGCPNYNSEEYLYCVNSGVAESTCANQAPRAACKYSFNHKSILGYVYLDTAPVAPAITYTPPLVVKSSNNYLSELTISNIEINFNKTILEYNFEVDNEVDNITIDSKAEHNKASIEGNGDFNLKIGENNFIIKVTAENKSVKEYKINIFRKESSNNYLSELIISDIEFDFNKNQLVYNLEVENKVNEVFITAIKEDKKAIVDGIHFYDLIVGENNFVIKVTAEDESIKEYKINIFRKNKKANIIFLIIFLLIMIILFGICIFIFNKKLKLKKRKRNNKKYNKEKKQS